MLWSYKKILVAVEDENSGDHLCSFISDQNWSCDVEFRLVHVVQPPPEDDPVVMTKSIKEAEKYGQFVLDRCAQKLADSLHAPIGERLILGYIAEQIKIEIENWKPDLLIVGSHGRSAVGKWFFGSVSEVLLYQVSCPVLLIRPAKESNKLANSEASETASAAWSKVIVAVEDSGQSQLLVDQIVSHKWPDHTVFTVVHVLDKETLHETGPYAWDGAREREEAKASALVKGIANRIKTMMPACEVRESVIVGTPSKDLLKYAAQTKSDLLITGTHGRAPAAKWFFGSVSQPLLSKAQCAVVVIKPAKVPVKT